MSECERENERVRETGKELEGGGERVEESERAWERVRERGRELWRVGYTDERVRGCEGK